MNLFFALMFTFLSSLACIISDILSKLFNGSIEDLLFIRFFLATLISFLWYKSFSFISIKNIIRGLFFACSMMCFTYGLKLLPLTLVILINFATPIWTIIFAKLFLYENINHRLFSSLVNTIGILIAIYPFLNSSQNIKPIIALIVASILFSFTDIINKTSVNNNENIGDIIIGSAFFSCLFCLPKYSFTFPSNYNLLILIGISLSSLAIPFFMLMASKRTNLSALQPLKYLEFPMTIIANNIIFHEEIYNEIYYGFFIIFIGTIINYIYEIKFSNN